MLQNLANLKSTGATRTFYCQAVNAGHKFTGYQSHQLRLRKEASHRADHFLSSFSAVNVELLTVPL